MNPLSRGYSLLQDAQDELEEISASLTADYSRKSVSPTKIIVFVGVIFLGYYLYKKL